MIDVSVIVPTINEAENIPLIVPRIAAALAGNSYEILIVDDNSSDNTPGVCAELARAYPVRLLVRTRPADGLSGAVLHGMAQARGEFLVVMDADLQHPPEKLAEFLGPLKENEADFVLGSRYVAGGGTAEGWTFYRRVNSGVSTLLARPFAGNVSDPMSGFFALRRETYVAARRLTPLGYKIGLELICKCRVRRVKEIPILFGLRQRGQSKLSLKQQFRYLEHLSRLYDFSFPRASPAIKFLIATGLSWLTGFAAYCLCGNAALAYLPALAVTIIFHVRYLRTQRKFIPRQRPWLDFAVVSTCEFLVCCTFVAWTEARVNHPGRWERFVYPFAAATTIRYVLRKELLQDIRGLRRDARAEELADLQPPPTAQS